MNAHSHASRSTGKRSAVIIVVRRERGKWLFLLLRAYAHWDFPKGLVEQGEQPIDAAIRETIEETSIAELDFRWGRQSMETEPYANGKVAEYFVAETTTREVVFGINPELGGAEHHEYRWANLDQAIHLLPERLRPILKWANALVQR